MDVCMLSRNTFEVITHLKYSWAFRLQNLETKNDILPNVNLFLQTQVYGNFKQMPPNIWDQETFEKLEEQKTWFEYYQSSFELTSNENVDSMGVIASSAVYQ